MQINLGAYALDALEPDEAAAVQQHLAECPACRDEFDCLASTTPLLALLSLDDVERLAHPEGCAPPPRPRRRRRVLLSAAAGAAVAASALVGARVLDNGSGPARPDVVRVAATTAHARAAVTMTGHSWGTQLKLSLAGAYPSGWCALVAHSRDGRSDTAATWVADPSGAAQISGTTAIRVAQLSELDVVTATGTVLARLAVPHPDG